MTTVEVVVCAKALSSVMGMSRYHVGVSSHVCSTNYGPQVCVCVCACVRVCVKVRWEIGSIMLYVRPYQLSVAMALATSVSVVCTYCMFGVLLSSCGVLLVWAVVTLPLSLVIGCQVSLSPLTCHTWSVTFQVCC